MDEMHLLSIGEQNAYTLRPIGDKEELHCHNNISNGYQNNGSTGSSVSPQASTTKDQVIANVTSLNQQLETNGGGQSGSTSCVFIKEQYERILEMLNKNNSILANANVAGTSDLSGVRTTAAKSFRCNGTATAIDMD
ncbi:hypothetical protein HAX54_041215 [Datura stramonium]|uniref:Uncharacterized protein n=1 Tax=Datura stramonium TaxID=4076 RepID=A0ABS8VQE0_DATST|nr:hypothetical protein [Datura stramonium]